MKVAELLLAHGAELDAADPETGDTPLYDAVSFGRAGFAKLLIARGANTSVKLKSGKTIADAARASGLEELLRKPAAPIRDPRIR